MVPSLQSLGIDQLTNEEKLRLIGEIWDSITPPQQLEIPEWHRVILEQRLAEMKDNPEEGSSWEEVKARLLEGR